MKILMLGWEFPPFISGGLGTACYGLTRAMSRTGTEIIFILPRPVSGSYSTHVKMAGPGYLTQQGDIYHLPEFAHVKFRAIASALSPYQSPKAYEELLAKLRAKGLAQLGASTELPEFSQSREHYGSDLFEEVNRYARLSALIAQEEEFDIVHAHDWMTFPAGIAVSSLTGKPLIVHVHSTEFDRSGEHVNQRVYDIERQGLYAANKIIAVSYLTRQIIISRYSIPPDKVSVVYNAVDMNGRSLDTETGRWPPLSPSRLPSKAMRRSFSSWGASPCRKARNTSWQRPKRSSRSWTTSNL